MTAMRREIEESSSSGSDTLPKDVDVLIVGAGHAGLAMAGFLGQAGREHLVIDRRLVAFELRVEQVRPANWLPTMTRSAVGRSRHRDPVSRKNGGMVARRRQGTSVIYYGSDPTVVAFCQLVCAPLGNDRRAKTG